MRVLILGGGGTLGAFSAGALRALERMQWTPDALIGSSAGSINLLRSFVGGADAACAFWTSLTAREVLSATILHNMLRDGLLSPRQLYERVDAGVDYDRVLRDPRPIGFIVVDLQTGKVAVRGNRSEQTAGDLRDVAHGSFSLPPLLPAVRLGTHLLADGGFLRNAPLETALDLGATEIVYLCNVQVAPRDDFRPSWAPRTLLRYANIYFRRASNIGYADAPIVESHYHGVPFLTIAPPSSLRLFQAAVPTGAAMKKLVAMGEERAQRAIEAAQHVAPGIGESAGLRPSVVG